MMGTATHLLTDKIVVQSFTGLSDYGDPTYASAKRQLIARVEDEVKLVIGADNNETQANHKILTEEKIQEADKIWLPGDNSAVDDDARRPVAFFSAATPDGYRLFGTWL